MTVARPGIVAAAVVGVLLVACGDGAGTSAADPSATASATSAATPTTAPAVCADPVEPPLQDGSHLIGDAEPPVAYSSTPPTSGWHASGNPRTGVIPADDPLTDPELVLTIEVGQVVVAYDPARLDAAVVSELETLATGTYPDDLTVTPYEGAEAPVSLVAWGVLQSCDGLDTEVLDAFVAAHADPHADAH